jgi:hypothetical protein
MVDFQPELTEEIVSRVEEAADEEVLAGMVKTAIRSNLNGEPADKTTSLTEVAEKRTERERSSEQDKEEKNRSLPVTWMELESTVGQDPDITDAQRDGFRYDYDDNM